MRLDNVNYPLEPECSDDLMPIDLPDAMNSWESACDEITIKQLQAELDKLRWIPVEERLPEAVKNYPVMLIKKDDLDKLKKELSKRKEFDNNIARLTMRTITDNTTDDAEENGVAEMLREFIATARKLDIEFKGEK